MTYQQLLASAMLKMGDNDRAGALEEFEAALAEAQRIDPEGPREGEVLNYMALFHEQAGETNLAIQRRDAAKKIFSKYEVFE
jgi:hypothetical protein